MFYSRNFKKITGLRKVQFEQTEGLLIADRTGEIGFINIDTRSSLDGSNHSVDLVEKDRASYTFRFTKTKQQFALFLSPLSFVINVLEEAARVHFFRIRGHQIYNNIKVNRSSLFTYHLVKSHMINQLRV